MTDDTREQDRVIAYTPPIRWVKVQNSDTVAVPPYGVMGTVDVAVVDGEPVITVSRPTANSAVLFNGAAPIPPGQYGQGHQTYPAIAAYDPGFGLEPKPGDNWGPGEGSFYLQASQRGFWIIGGAGGTADSSFVNVSPFPPLTPDGGSGGVGGSPIAISVVTGVCPIIQELPAGDPGTVVDPQHGGTGLTTLGTPGQVLTTNPGATGVIWTTPSGGAASFTIDTTVVTGGTPGYLLTTNPDGTLGQTGVVDGGEWT